MGGFDNSLRSCEDWDLWCRLALTGTRTVTIPTIGAYYRRHNGSMSTQASLMLQTRIEVLLRVHKRIVADPELLERYGADLNEAEQRSVRRLCAQGGSHATGNRIGRVVASTSDLRRAQQTVASAHRRGAILGYSTAEALSVAFLRMARPSVFDRYRHGYCCRRKNRGKGNEGIVGNPLGPCTIKNGYESHRRHLHVESRAAVERNASEPERTRLAEGRVVGSDCRR